MDKKTKTNPHLLIAIIGMGRDKPCHIMRDGALKASVVVFEKLSEEPPALSELILERIPILPFPLEILDRQFKFSHYSAPRMRHDRSTVKNYDKKLRAKSKKFKNKKGRGGDCHK